MLFVWLPKHDKAKVVQTLLFVTGIKTLLQTLFGTRLPTVIGGSYAFVVPVLSIIRDRSFAQIDDGHIVSIKWFFYIFCLIPRTMATRIRITLMQIFMLCISVDFLVYLQRFIQTMRAIQGALIVSSRIQIILGYSQLWAICSRYKKLPLLL